MKRMQYHGKKHYDIWSRKLSWWIRGLEGKSHQQKWSIGGDTAKREEGIKLETTWRICIEIDKEGLSYIKGNRD